MKRRPDSHAPTVQAIDLRAKAAGTALPCGGLGMMRMTCLRHRQYQEIGDRREPKSSGVRLL